MARVILESITKEFDGVRAVSDLSVSIGDGQFVTFLGPSGCGKTTTLRMIAGFIEPTAGRVIIGDSVVSSPSEHVLVQPEERNIGMVFQSYAVWPHMKVVDNVAYPLKFRRMHSRQRRERAEQALAMVHLDGLADRYPHQLSGGQQQRVALARALVHEPDVMLLDEPLSNLDAKLREDMRFEIKELQSRTGLTIVYVTHDQGEAMAMSDCVVVMDQGRVMQIGSPMEVYEQPADQWVAGFIGLTNLLPCRVSESEDGVRGVRLGDAGNVFVPCKTPPGETGNGLLSVRPENIVISLPGTGAGIRAVVERATYMGHVTDYLVRVETLSLRAQIMGRVRLKTGDDVRVLLEDPIFFPAQRCATPTPMP